MTKSSANYNADYPQAYADGKRAGENKKPYANPFNEATDPSKFHGWKDGHYDAWSKRQQEIAKFDIWGPQKAKTALTC